VQEGEKISVNQRREQKKVPAFDDGDFQNKSGNVLLSHTFTRVVPSAQEGLTAEFGMGSGVTPPL
jgi:hypothetical protein